MRKIRSYMSAYDAQNGNGTDLLIIYYYCYYYYSVASDDSADSQEDIAVL